MIGCNDAKEFMSYSNRTTPDHYHRTDRVCKKCFLSRFGKTFRKKISKILKRKDRVLLVISSSTSSKCLLHLISSYNTAVNKVYQLDVLYIDDINDDIVNRNEVIDYAKSLFENVHLSFFDLDFFSQFHNFPDKLLSVILRLNNITRYSRNNNYTTLILSHEMILISLYILLSFICFRPNYIDYISTDASLLHDGIRFVYPLDEFLYPEILSYLFFQHLLSANTLRHIIDFNNNLFSFITKTVDNIELYPRVKTKLDETRVIHFPKIIEYSNLKETLLNIETTAVSILSSFIIFIPLDKTIVFSLLFLFERNLHSSNVFSNIINISHKLKIISKNKCDFCNVQVDDILPLFDYHFCSICYSFFARLPKNLANDIIKTYICIRD